MMIRAVMSYKVSRWHVAVFLLVTITAGIFFCKILITTTMNKEGIGITYMYLSGINNHLADLFITTLILIGER